VNAGVLARLIVKEAAMDDRWLTAQIHGVAIVLFLVAALYGGWQVWNYLIRTFA
jgi:hypothetical protein